MSLYEHNRVYVRFNPPWCITQSLHEGVTNWISLPQSVEQGKIARRREIICYFISWRLYNLYGFDCFTDLIYDTIFILVLYVFEIYIQLLVPNLTDLDREKELEETLQIVSQPVSRPKGLGQRWPTSLTALEFFKAEEYIKFILWCLSFMLEK